MWRGAAPILARGETIWWPGAAPDLSGGPRMAVLQHELQDVLDWATGRLTAADYLSNPRDWTYAWRLEETSRWSDFGAEQRASMAEALWLTEHGGASPATAQMLRRVIPWARV